MKEDSTVFLNQLTWLLPHVVVVTLLVHVTTFLFQSTTLAAHQVKLSSLVTIFCNQVVKLLHQELVFANHHTILHGQVFVACAHHITVTQWFTVILVSDVWSESAWLTIRQSLHTEPACRLPVVWIVLCRPQGVQLRFSVLPSSSSSSAHIQKFAVSVAHQFHVPLSRTYVVVPLAFTVVV